MIRLAGCMSRIVRKLIFEVPGLRFKTNQAVQPQMARDLKFPI